MLNDDSPMPFGKHKGEPMQDVPVEYLHWCYFNVTGYHAKELKNYIEQNLDALKQENPDLIWR